MAKYKIEFDRDKCIGAGFCAKIDPNLWRMGDDGKSMLNDSSR